MKAKKTVSKEADRDRQRIKDAILKPDLSAGLRSS